MKTVEMMDMIIHKEITTLEEHSNKEKEYIKEERLWHEKKFQNLG